MHFKKISYNVSVLFVNFLFMRFRILIALSALLFLTWCFNKFSIGGVDIDLSGGGIAIHTESGSLDISKDWGVKTVTEEWTFVLDESGMVVTDKDGNVTATGIITDGGINISGIGGEFSLDQSGMVITDKDGNTTTGIFGENNFEFFWQDGGKFSFSQDGDSFIMETASGRVIYTESGMTLIDENGQEVTYTFHENDNWDYTITDGEVTLEVSWDIVRMIDKNWAVQEIDTSKEWFESDLSDEQKEFFKSFQSSFWAMYGWIFQGFWYDLDIETEGSY